VAGVRGRSGGANRLPIEQHELRGTLRPARHLAPAPLRPEAITVADRRRALRGLNPVARRIAAGLVSRYGGWDEAALATLRSYALSCARAQALEHAAGADSRALHREIRINLGLLKALNLEAQV